MPTDLMKLSSREPSSPRSAIAPNHGRRSRSLLRLMQLLILLTAILGAHAAAAGFDCSKAKSSVERLICQDPKTSDLDAQLSKTYKTALAATTAPGKKALVQEQRNWIEYSRDLCQDTTCLQAAYAARIQVLARNDKYIVNKTACATLAEGACSNVVFYRDPNSRIDAFNKSLAAQSKPGKIIGCRQLVDLPVGTANGNHSFGGFCLLQNDAQRSDVEICNDDMLGHFAIQAIDPNDATDKNLIEFTHSNCFGG